MALKVKAKEKLLKFSKQSEGSWRYGFLALRHGSRSLQFTRSGQGNT